MCIQFDDLKVIFNILVQDSELVKILIPSDDELAKSLNGNNEKYNTRVENRLTCNICHFYKYIGKDNAYSPEYCPFYCYHYYHGDCLEDRKLFVLKQNKEVAKQINCPYYRPPVKDVLDN